MLEVFLFIAATFGTAKDRGFMRVIPGAFLGIGEDFVGSLDFSKADCCFFFSAMIAIRMEVEGTAAVGLFNSVYLVRKYT